MTEAVTTLLGCAHPVVLAGMGGPSRAELVIAVSRAGGFGFLGMVREPVALIEAEVARLREAGITRFGVNIIPAATGRELLDAQVEALIRLAVPVVALFWDIDAALVARLKAAGITVVYQVGSADEAKAAEAAGADLIIAQGREAGGHVRGTTPLRRLLPEVINAVSLPVLAAGGLATGQDLFIAQALGAGGIVLGTALLASEESFAHIHHKRRLVGARAGDTLLTETFHINWPFGARVRVLANMVTAGLRGPSDGDRREVIGDEEGRPIYLFSTDSPLHSMTGDFEAMALYAGTGVGSVTSIRSAGAVIADLLAEAETLRAATKPLFCAPAETSSPVCYAAEMDPAYAGQLDAGAVAETLPGILSTLTALLVAGHDAGKGSEPPFVAADLTWARYLAALRDFAPKARLSPPDPNAEALRKRLRTLLPNLPEGALRAGLASLAEALETPEPVA